MVAQFWEFAVASGAAYSVPPLCRAGNYNFNTAALNNRGTNGYGWASTANSAQNGYNLNFNQSNVNPGTNNNNKGNGLQLRCVAQ